MTTIWIQHCCGRYSFTVERGAPKHWGRNGPHILDVPDEIVEMAIAVRRLDDRLQRLLAELSERQFERREAVAFLEGEERARHHLREENEQVPHPCVGQTAINLRYSDGRYDFFRTLKGHGTAPDDLVALWEGAGEVDGVVQAQLLRRDIDMDRRSAAGRAYDSGGLTPEQIADLCETEV